MSAQTPSEDLASKISSIQSRISQLQEAVQLTSARDSIEDLQTTVNNLSQRIAALRSKGYAFDKNLEGQAADYQKQWQELSPSVTQQINNQASSLQAAIRTLEAWASQLISNPSAAQSAVTSLEADVQVLEDKVAAAERTISGMYNQFYSQVGILQSRLQRIEWMMTELSEATFQLLPTESGIMAVKAVWARTGEEKKDDPEGVLYLTDQRLIFEQKEEVATKKVLFIATEKQKIQDLMLDMPVGLVEGIEISKKGLMKNEDHIALKCAAGAPVNEARFHIWQSNEEWQSLINRAKAGEFDKDRAIEIDQETLDKVKSVPGQCPSCGGKIDQVVMRGMDSITCEFCGSVIRL
jgi:DNA repair exonuclease SbcCD ATPase subunit